jgi:sugar lactone lactonase YvrE
VCADVSRAPVGTICTVLGIPATAMFSAEGLPAAETALYLPIDMNVGPDGLLYVIDFNNHRVRRVDADGAVRTVVGNGYPGDGPEGPALEAHLDHPGGMAFDPADPTQLYLAGWGNSRIAAVDLASQQYRFVAGTGVRDHNGDGLPGPETAFHHVSGIAFDDDGSLLFIDQGNALVRRLRLDGTVETLAGAPPALQDGWSRSNTGWEGDGTAQARFDFGSGAYQFPGGGLVRVGRALYLADKENHVVRALDLDTGIVRHVAGTGLIEGYAGDGGPAAAAQLNYPSDLAAGPGGALYIADTRNHCVRKIDADGVITTVAGVCAAPGIDGDGVPATEAQLYQPYGVEVTDDLLYIADTQSQLIRAVKL